MYNSLSQPLSAAHRVTSSETSITVPTEGDTNRTCPHCRRGFDTMRGLRIHIGRIHGQIARHPPLSENDSSDSLYNTLQIELQKRKKIRSYFELYHARLENKLLLNMLNY